MTNSFEVLELCCPAGSWDEVRAVVAGMDALKRTVKRNRLFTKEWAGRLFAKARAA